MFILTLVSPETVIRMELDWFLVIEFATYPCCFMSVLSIHILQMCAEASIFCFDFDRDAKYMDYVRSVTVLSFVWESGGTMVSACH